MGGGGWGEGGGGVAANGNISVWHPRARGTSLPACQGHLPARRARKMMTMNGKQHFTMHPALHEPKYPGLHASSEGMRRVCLPAPQVRFWVNSSDLS